MKPARSYVICCVQRTGSWLLANTLADTGYAGRPSDYFDEEERKTHTREWGLSSDALAPYIAAVREHATTPNGMLGSKLMWNDFDWHRNSRHPSAGTDAGLEFMRTAFGDPRFVWLRRLDKVRQGISWWRASVTGQWGLRPDQRAGEADQRAGEADQRAGELDQRAGEPVADVEPIVRLIRFAEQCEAGWRQWFASTGIQPCEVSYEDLAQDRLAVANRVLGFLDLPRLEPGDLPPVRYRQQADRLTGHYADLIHAVTGGRAGPG